MSTADQALAHLAAQQHGAISLGQARGAGLTRTQVDHRLATGRWLRIGRGVYAIAGSPPTWHRQTMAALLSRSDAVLAELSAAHAAQLVDAPLERPAIIVPPGTSARAPGAGRVHRLALDLSEVTVLDGLRCTSPARTLIDLTRVLPARALARVVDHALHRGAASVRQIDLALGRATHLSGVQRSALVRAVDAWRGIRPGSPGEVRLLRQLAEWGIDEPERQVPIIDPSGETVARADLGWSRVQFGLEYDGAEHHGPNRWAFDEARHARIVALGWRLHHVGARDLLPSSDLRGRILRAFGAAA
jgi:hypothetical protein